MPSPAWSKGAYAALARSASGLFFLIMAKRNAYSRHSHGQCPGNRNIRLSRRRRRDGQIDPIDGLVKDAAWTNPILAAKPAHDSQSLSRLELPDFPGLGS